MKAKDAKKLICACKVRKGRDVVICGRHAVITIRIETEGKPEFLTFCSEHLKMAENAIHAIRKILE